MDKAYVAKKTGKMGLQSSGSVAIAGTIVVVAGWCGKELSANEVVTVMAGVTVIVNMIIKMVEKIRK